MDGVCRCKAELDSSDSALDTRSGCEQVPDMTSQMMDLQQQLLYDVAWYVSHALRACLSSQTQPILPTIERQSARKSKTKNGRLASLASNP